MKHLLIALMVATAFCSMTFAQQKTTISKDSISKAKATMVQTETAKTAETKDSTDIAEYTDVVDSSTTNNDQSFSVQKSDFLEEFGDNSTAVVIVISSLIAVFGFPIFIIFIAFYFRYKNRKAKYKLVEQALAAGQPLPENFLNENQQSDSRSKGIKNTFTGLGLFIFLWAITGNFGIGCIGLLVMLTGIGQWVLAISNDKRANKNNEER